TPHLPPFPTRRSSDLAYAGAPGIPRARSARTALGADPACPVAGARLPLGARAARAGDHASHRPQPGEWRIRQLVGAGRRGHGVHRPFPEPEALLHPHAGRAAPADVLHGLGTRLPGGAAGGGCAARRAPLGAAVTDAAAAHRSEADTEAHPGGARGGLRLVGPGVLPW